MDRLSTKGQMIDQIDLSAVPHSGFDRSNHNYLTGKLGAIIPTRLDEVYPGDRIKGSPQLVANFEPLVAPLMGSMVLKQESFFVPYPQLWRHSYKFFTGKNGFDELMPSVTPRRIFDVYSLGFLKSVYEIGISENYQMFNFIVHNLSQLRQGYTTDTTSHYSDFGNGTLLEDMQELLASFYGSLKNTYESRKMFDLVLPIYQHFKTYVESPELLEMSVELENEDSPVESRKSIILHFSSDLGQILYDIHQFFFGPSSLFDYLGWPITIDDNLKSDVQIPEYGITNIFQYCIYRNIIIWGSFNNLQESIADMFSAVPLNFLPFKGYYLVWYWNYRDQLLETDILDPEEDEFLGSTITDNVILYCTLMRQRCWFKDAYTTALTNTGDGNLLVPTQLSIGDEASYEYYDSDGNLIETTDAASAYQSGATVCKVSTSNYEYSIPMNYLRGASDGESRSTSIYTTENFLSLDLFDRIKRLRSVVQKRLILGYEVDDVIWSSFMVRLSNVRMHIPEILGRGRDAVEISTLVNNTSTAQQIAGDKTATAWVKGSISEVNYFAEEWGFYLQFATIMPIQSYAGGMQRLYLKRDPLDYMWPEYSTMGMDAIYNVELGAFGTHLSDENGLAVFGYNGRYYDLKYRQDEEHGRLLTDLNYLTFSREFDNDNPPRLNYMFVHCWPRLDGFVIESPLVDVFRADCYTAQGWERRLPVPSQFVH